jgi:Predicted phosphoesterases, related to the Icc protein
MHSPRLIACRSPAPCISPQKIHTMSKTLRVAAVGDLHYTRHSRGKAENLFTAMSAAADVAVLCGDLTDYGLPDEAALLAADIRSHLRIPVLAVVGNHDFESGHVTEVQAALDAVGVQFLEEEEVCECGGVGFAGVCGFGGGFDQCLLNAWGEPIIKSFVQEAVDQALRLEKALGRLQTPKKIAVLHYAPIRGTVVGENAEIFPFLGSSRLEAPLNRFAVHAVFHGHAHAGTLQGRTSAGVPVYNVAQPLLERRQPGKPPFCLLDVEA